jgi:endonuclease/exonuclease/phosphatase family metal-dependent hydrolase
MQRFVWSSDIHLDRLEEDERRELREYLLELEPAALILAGDIDESSA